MGGLFSALKALFFSKRLEVVLVGLENSGKTTFCNQLEFGSSDIEDPPTVGLNVRVMKRGGISFKVWDIGGQEQYRKEWARYTRGMDCVVFVVDTADRDRIPTAKKELHRLLDDPALSTVPLLVLANKVDLKNVVSESDLIRGLNLDTSLIINGSWLQ
uniref:ADP-ribosylation factor family n=1 Tax=Hirondellea gigas TaxID=1518452 RepID=A0A2R5L1K6_9CRUS